MVGEAFARNCCLSLQFLKEQKYFYIRYIKTFIWGGKGTCTYLLMGEICPSSKFAWAHNKIIISVLCFSSGYLLPLQILSSSFCIFSLSLFNMLEKILISFLVWEWGKAQKELVTERKAGLWSHPPSGEFQMLRSDVVSKYPAVKHWMMHLNLFQSSGSWKEIPYYFRSHHEIMAFSSSASLPAP